MTARILDVTPEEYHKLPGLSASAAIALRHRSPAHAKLERDDGGCEPTDLTDRGAVFHHLILGRGKRFAPCPFDDFRTKAAKKTRDDYRAAGLIPVLTEKLEEYETAAREIRKRMDEAGIWMTSGTGRAECAIGWDERWNGTTVPCRSMMDYVDTTLGVIYELKIVDDASPERLERHVESMGYRIQAAAYIRALVALRPELMGQIEFRFVFAEPTPPYAVYAPWPDGYFLEGGERDWLSAVATWGQCLAAGEWPHYQHHKSLGRPRWALRQEGYATNE